MSTESIEFTERMSGSWSANIIDLSTTSLLPTQQIGISERDANRKPCEFTVTIKIADLDAFLINKDLTAEIEGTVLSPFSNQFIKIQSGIFNLFTSPQASPSLDVAKEMHYCLFLEENNGHKWTLYGFKEILKEQVSNAWKETTTLYFYSWEGHSHLTSTNKKNVIGLGVLHINPSDFLKQLTTFKTTSSANKEPIEIISKFMGIFAKNLWEAYAPFVFTTTSYRWNEHIIPLQSTVGVTSGDKQIIPFHSSDGLHLSFSRFKKEDSKNIVLLLHGLTTSTDMYIMPEHKNLVSHLHNQGFNDVWSLDWRGSCRHIYNLSPHRYTIDDIANYDIPPAIEKIRSLCGEDVNIHVICHCVGSLSFMSSLAAGRIQGIKSVISNSVSLSPIVRWQTRLKLIFGPTILEYVLRYLYISPKLAYLPGPVVGKWLYWMERSMRKECKEPACHMISFMWGWGFPAAFEHKNMDPITHRRLSDLFGGTSFHYYRHILKMIFAKASVSWAKDRTSINYLEEAKKRKLPPILFISGTKNNIFPKSNEYTFQSLSSSASAASVSNEFSNSASPAKSNFRYQEFEGYGHQDVFMGKNCHIDVFPTLTNFIKEHV